DPDNPTFVPPVRLPDGSLQQLEDGQPSVTYAATGLPAGATFDSDTTLFTWTPDYSTAGIYFVSFTATDDGDGTGVPANATRIVPIVVSNSNRSPQVDPIVNQSVDRGATLDIAVHSTDPDNDPLKLSVAGLPRFASFIDNGDGTGTIHFAPGNG